MLLVRIGQKPISAIDNLALDGLLITLSGGEGASLGFLFYNHGISVNEKQRSCIQLYRTQCIKFEPDATVPTLSGQLRVFPQKSIPGNWTICIHSPTGSPVPMLI